MRIADKVRQVNAASATPPARAQAPQPDKDSLATDTPPPAAVNSTAFSDFPPTKVCRD